MTRRISSPVFVGRRAELDRLKDAFDRASDGRPSLVLIAGDAGVGKSRLLAEFSAHVEAVGGRTLSGGCLDLGEGSLPYAPFVEALRSLARELPPEVRAAAFGPVPAELANLVPDLLSVDLPAAVASEMLAGRQARLFDAIIGVLWAEAAGRWGALPHPLHQAEALLRQAEAILGGGGERPEAEAALRASYATAVAIGAAPLRAELEALARRAKIDLEDPSPLPIDRGDAPAAAAPVVLTAREREVLRLVTEGHTNREIGDRLFISEKTVSVHVSNAMAKLGALSRYEAAASAEKLGLT